MDELIYEVYKESLTIGQCGMLTGRESVEDICKLIFKAQGIEYMTTHSFPSLDLMQRIDKKHDISQYHVYVNKRKVAINNFKKVCGVGATEIEIWCNETKAYHIHLLHGARAIIHSGGYAVVSVEKDALSSVVLDVKGNSKICGHD